MSSNSSDDSSEYVTCELGDSPWIDSEGGSVAQRADGKEKAANWLASGLRRISPDTDITGVLLDPRPHTHRVQGLPCPFLRSPDENCEWCSKGFGDDHTHHIEPLGCALCQRVDCLLCADKPCAPVPAPPAVRQAVLPDGRTVINIQIKIQIVPPAPPPAVDITIPAYMRDHVRPIQRLHPNGRSSCGERGGLCRVKTGCGITMRAAPWRDPIFRYSHHRCA